MYRLGLRLILEGGREALIRLMLTVVAVAVGVTILLSVFADFHAFQSTSDRPSWESTQGASVDAHALSNPNAELWNYSENIYQGQFIEELDIAALGPNAPVLPGISELPGPGQFYASPELAHLLQTVPKDELGNRFAGTQIGTIGQKALYFPNELVIYSGKSPSQLAGLADTQEVTTIATQAQLQGTTNIYRDAFGIGAIAILFPLLILVNTATRLSATRREERYAAMRLIGATPHQINVIASVDAIVGSFLGALLGIVVFLLIRPAIANIAFSGVKFFPNYVTPTIWGYIGLVVGIPIIAAIASLISLHRVQISPLGVSRKAAPKKPSAWRLVPLALGIPLLLWSAHQIGFNHHANGPAPLLAGFLLIMIGIVISGSWLTMRATMLVARFTKSAPSLLASRRLSDNPKGAFRAISGLVLAVFVASFVSVLVPAFNALENPSGQTSLSNVLRVPYQQGPDSQLTVAQSKALVSKLRSYAGTTVVPIYVNPAFTTFFNQQLAQNGKVDMCRGEMCAGPQVNPPAPNIVSCASIAELGNIGTCNSGVNEVAVDAGNLMSGDNPLSIYRSLPLANSRSQSSTISTDNLQLAGVLDKIDNLQTLEQVRTYLTQYNDSLSNSLGKDGLGNNLSSWQMGALEPETIGELAKIRANDTTNVGRAVLAVVALTLITAGCSLAVTTGGSLVERKRPFTLLRVSGVSLRTLYEVVLLEAALPLIVVSVVAAGVGVGVAIPVVKTLLETINSKANLPVHPESSFYIALGAGLVISLILVALTLPILRNTTKPEDARFE